MKTYIALNRKNLLHNLDFFKQLTASRLLLTVKANAYGHGLKEILEIVRGYPFIDYFGVDNLAEARQIRAADINKPVLIFGWSSRQELEEILQNSFETVLPSLESYYEILSIARRRQCQAQVHLKVETGTNRLGMKPRDIIRLLPVWDTHHLAIKGVYSHFANIEDTSDYSFARKQLAVFNAFLKRAKFNNVIRHFSCSASALLFPETYYDLVRLGIAAYGYWPSKQTLVSFQERRKLYQSLKPVLSWHTYIAQIKELKAGEAVGYGLSYKAYRRTKIAVIPVGYYDGYPRALSNLSSVIINGEFAPVRGRVCMNMFMVEVTHIKKCAVGTPVILIGEQNGKVVDAEQLAQYAGTINYEILARLNPLLPRIIV